MSQLGFLTLQKQAGSPFDGNPEYVENWGGTIPENTEDHAARWSNDKPSKGPLMNRMKVILQGKTKQFARRQATVEMPSRIGLADRKKLNSMVGVR